MIPILVLAGLSTAPAAPTHSEEPAKPTPLAQARYQSALEQYDLAWSYFQQNRLDSFQVYLWSRLVLDSRRELGEKPADRIAALKAHLARMQKMENLAKKIRRLGFGRSYEVGASEYYRLEAEHWLEQSGVK